MSEPNWPQGPRFVVRARWSAVHCPGGVDYSESRWYVVDRAYSHQAVARATNRGTLGRRKMEARADELNALDRNALTGNEGAATIAPVPAYCALFQDGG